MNHFSYEFMSKEKVNNLLEEGTRSQAVHRSCAPLFGLLRGWPKLTIGLLGFLVLLAILVR